MFDSLTGIIDSFVARGRVHSIWDEETRALDAAALSVWGPRPSRKNSIAGLDTGIEAAERRLAELAPKRSVEFQLALLRRFPLAMFPPGWLETVTLTLAKYGTFDAGAVMFRGERDTGLVVVDDGSSVEDSFRFARAAERLCHYAGVRRWVGKGALITVTGEGWGIDVGDDVREAVGVYEARRPRRLFADRGIYAPDDAGEAPILFLEPSPAVIYYFVPERGFSLRANYLPLTLSATQILSALSAYTEIIEDLNPPLRVNDVVQILAAVTRLCIGTVRPLKPPNGGRWELESTGNAEADAHNLNFTFDLYQTAYLRRTRAAWISELSRVTSPWAPTREAAAEAAERFLAACTVTPEARQQIDLRTLRPHPIMFVASSGGYYFDLAAVAPWLEGLVEDAQRWWESQHGDRFALALKQYLVRRVGVDAVRARWSFTDDRGRRRVADLAVVIGEKVYCIECKAFAKSASFFRGDPAAVSSRTQRIKKALDQATEAADAVRDGRSELRAPAIRDVVALVCTPSQEFLKPPGRFGWLARGIPAVCTPEELAHVVEQQAGAA